MHQDNVAGMQQFSYTEGMTAALGGYVKTLRLRQGLSKAEVLRRIEKRFGAMPDRTTYYRLEKGRHWPDSNFLTALLAIIGGQLDDLVWFLDNRDAPEIEGCQRAETWIRDHGAAADVDTVVRAQSRADAQEIAEELEELAKRIRVGRE